MNRKTLHEALYVAAILAFGVAVCALILVSATGCDCGGAELDGEGTDAELADKAVKSTGGKYVRMVGRVDFDKDAETKNTALGDIVEVQPKDVPADAICNVVLDAQPVAVKIIYPDAEWVGNVPNIPALRDEVLEAKCWPVLITGSCTGQPVNTCLWNTFLKGAACTKAADLPQYVGSTAREFHALPFALRQRLLRTRGRCGVGGNVPCMVPVGDPRALAGERVYVPHRWAERDNDLNFVGKTNDEYESRADVHK
jgi:hypothetical protein